MSKVVKARYDANENILRLKEKLEGVSDQSDLEVTIAEEPVPTGEAPWMKLRGIMDKERGDDFARAIEEMFPPWTGDE
ncbi:MAG TPA: hypothetical protein VEU30_16020 [Thermoanaerobaculia bacterium]|nr:hypothetical protein [Thermoanaerobaculia bacterium]